MAHVDLKQLVGRLNKATRDALEAAVGLCVARTNYHVEVEHWLFKLLEGSNTDFVVLLRQLGVDHSRLAADLQRAIDGFRTGSSRQPALSPDVVHLMREAWLIALDQRYRADGADGACAVGARQRRIAGADRRRRLAGARGPAPRGRAEPAGQCPAQDRRGHGRGGRSGAVRTATAIGGATPSLDQFTIDLTERARQGQIDPVLGRDSEIRQIVDILTRRRQNNPILTGEAGVGKTAVVEGFALRIAAGDVPPSLQNVSVRTLDLGLLQAGAGVKGEFENRLKSVIEEVKSVAAADHSVHRRSAHDDRRGRRPGQGDAANLLKPALARGELRTIAATTWAEYKKYFEKDAALARRFQVVKVEEPERAARRRHDARPGRDAGKASQGADSRTRRVVDAVKLSSRYISGRQLPDKSVSLLDTTCARIGLSRTATPPAIEDCRRRIEQIDVHDRILQRGDPRWARTTQNAARGVDRRAEPASQKSWPARKSGGSRERELIDSDPRSCGATD